ncbi:hypothetical protein JXA31_10190 [Candidatus Bathyarchaeota archaeon]|nr:hypothetical protein [Candidatus Bathyarchaeota archaeon]
MRKLKMNRNGQFSIIAALLVAVILIAAVMTTYSAIRYSNIQDQPQVLSAIDEINLALRQVVGFTVGYYGSVLQVTGNTTYARLLASNYLQSGLRNIGDIRPEWGASFAVTTLNLRTDWFSNVSYSSGNLSITYNLTGIGLTNMAYSASSRLDVEILESSPSQAFLSITKDESEPLVNLAKQNLRFYHYLDSDSTWELVAPTVDPVVYANGTYLIDFPAGVDPDSYVIKIEDNRGIIVVASSFSSYAASLIRNSTYTSADYVDNCDTDVDFSADIGSQSNFANQQSAPDSIYDTLTEVNIGSGMTTSTLLDESFDTTWYPTGWTVWGSCWTRSSSIKQDGAYSAYWDGTTGYRYGSMTTPDLDCSDADVIIVDFWYYDAGCGSNEFVLYFYDGGGWDLIYDLAGTTSTGTWLHFQWNYTESQYLKSNFKLRFVASTQQNGDDAYVDLVNVQKVVDGTIYHLDLEEQFTNVNYTDPQQDLCIKADSLGSEPLLVDAWTGSNWVNVATLTGLVNGWKNVSVASYLTSENFTIRFRGSSTGTDSVQDSWQIDSVLLGPQPDLSFLLSQQESTIVVEWLQNGTMRFLGQNLEMVTEAKAIPPISVKALHLNQTRNGVNHEVPFQVEDWASGYKIPLGLTSNSTVFGSSQMIVFLLDNSVSEFTLWWNGSDEATQTPLAYTNQYFTGDDPANNILTNGRIRLQIGSFSVTSTVVSTSTSSTANFMRINAENSVYGAGAAYVVKKGVVRDIVQQEAEWSGGAVDCPNVYANIVIILPANVTYYTYQLRLMFIESAQQRTITELCPIRVSTGLGSTQLQTENGTANGFPIVTLGTGTFYNYSSSYTAHHWSQIIAGTKGTGIMFTDVANQMLYAFDSTSPGTPTGALKASSGLLELLPVTLRQVQFTYAMDITWRGAVVTFDGTSPIYRDSDRGGLWLLVEYPPTVTVTAES